MRVYLTSLRLFLIILFAAVFATGCGKDGLAALALLGGASGMGGADAVTGGDPLGNAAGDSDDGDEEADDASQDNADYYIDENGAIVEVTPAEETAYYEDFEDLASEYATETGTGETGSAEGESGSEGGDDVAMAGGEETGTDDGENSGGSTSAGGDDGSAGTGGSAADAKDSEDEEGGTGLTPGTLADIYAPPAKEDEEGDNGEGESSTSEDCSSETHYMTAMTYSDGEKRYRMAGMGMDKMGTLRPFSPGMGAIGKTVLMKTATSTDGTEALADRTVYFVNQDLLWNLGDEDDAEAEPIVCETDPGDLETGDIPGGDGKGGTEPAETYSWQSAGETGTAGFEASFGKAILARDGVIIKEAGVVKTFREGRLDFRATDFGLSRADPGDYGIATIPYMILQPRGF